MKRVAQLGSGVTIALIYTRVSSDEQAREGLSLDAQLAACRKYAAQQGWVIGREFSDVMSGRRDDRPDYIELLAEIHRLRSQGQHVVVVVMALDRFGRRLLERVQCREELKRLGVDVHSVREGLVNDLMANMLAVLAQEEVERLSVRVREVREHVASLGWQPPGKPTWGLLFRPATAEELAMGSPKAVLDIDEVAEPFVRELFERCARGEGIRSLAQWAMSLPESVRGGRALTYQTLRTLLRGPVYAGYVDYPLGEGQELRRGRWRAIVDEATWRKVQARLDDHRRTPHQRSGMHLLTGLIRCARCGARMNGVTFRPSGLTSYVCGDERGANNGRNCRYKLLTRYVDDPVLADVAALLEAVMTPHGELRRALERAWTALRPGEGTGERKRRIATLEQQATKMRQRMTRATEMYVDGHLTRQAYDDLTRKAHLELGAAETALAELRSMGTTSALPPLDEVLTLFGGCSAVLRGTDSLGQHEVFKPLIEHVVAHRQHAGRYDVEIRWTPLGQALRTAARALTPEMAA